MEDKAFFGEGIYGKLICYIATMIRLILFVVFLTNIFISGCKVNTAENSQSKIEIKYRAADSNIVIAYFKDSDKFPDSLKQMVFTGLQIHCPELKDLNKILDHIKPDKLDYLCINSFSEDSVFNYDLSKFKKLEDLQIIGYEVRKLKLHGNIGAKLKSLTITGNLKFPDFDSSFLTLKFFNYKGVDSIIPKWIENLNELEHFNYDSRKITRIECDVCKMNSIEYFDISESDLYQKEMEKFKITGEYGEIRRFKNCKPEIEFKYILPPH